MWNLLSQVAAEMFPGSVDSLFPPKAYLRRTPCVITVERLIRLKENVRKQEQELRDKLAVAGERERLSVTLHSDGGGINDGGTFLA